MADRTRPSSECSIRFHTQHGSGGGIVVGQVCKVPGLVFNGRFGNPPHEGISVHFAPPETTCQEKRGGDLGKSLAHVLGIASLAPPGWLTQSKKPRVCTRGQTELPPENACTFQNGSGALIARANSELVANTWMGGSCLLRARISDNGVLPCLLQRGSRRR